jgi:hypothetical protein
MKLSSRTTAIFVTPPLLALAACGEAPTGVATYVTASPTSFRGVRTAGPDPMFVCYTSEPAGSRGYRYRRIRLPIPAEAMGGPLGSRTVTFRLRYQSPGKTPVAAANCRVPGTPAAIRWVYRHFDLEDRRRFNRVPGAPRFDDPCQGYSGCVLAPLIVIAPPQNWNGGWQGGGGGEGGWNASLGDGPSYGGGYDPGTPPESEGPCPPEFTVLNDPDVQAGFADLWQRSNADAPMKDRREQGGFLVNHGDGTFGLVPFPPEWASDPCQIRIPATFSSPPNTFAIVHTHPYAYHETLTSCDYQQLPGGIKLPVVYNGDTSFDDDSTMLRLRQDYPGLIGLVLDKDKIIAYNGDAMENRPISRCGY